jgi:hypothetical protein
MELELLMRESFYEKVDPRRRQELSDARMIQEDQRAMANLSEREINKEFNAWAYPERLAMYNQSDRKNR